MIVDIVFGFLGVGKTTFITRILKEWDYKEKTVVLVNEFGDVGIDGELLSERGGNVVEMPSGCICCTLQSDFRSQMLEIMESIQPDRVIIEPTGVATIAQVRSIIDAQLFEDAIQRVNNIMIADAVGFMELYKANRHFVESQVKNADVGILNKCDRVDAKRAMVTRSAISALNPEIAVLMTQFGAVDKAEYMQALSAAQNFSKTPDEHDHSHHHAQTGNVFKGIADNVNLHFHEAEDSLGYESYGRIFQDASFDLKALEQLFEKMNAPESSLGEIVRAKGIFRIADKGILMELASGEFSTQPAGLCEKTKVTVIGKNVNREKLDEELERCLAAEAPP
jgi:G3E family GTPase